MPADTPAAAAQIALCFGDVRHARLRPVENRFAYGVFFLRLPLRALEGGPRRLAPGFSLDRFNLLSFHQRDHGDGRGDLRGFITRLLQAEGIHDADGEIVLQAFPRVLGFVFNPVAFWFCHRADGGLRAILCEVNNTFGEKHYYLLEKPAGLAWGEELQARKVFHVSPFCAIEGGYRFRFMHSADGARHVARIEHDDAHGPLILTSVSGRAEALSGATVARALLRHPLLCLAVVARIHWQALRLWRQRVPFFRKPLPPATEISR